jgi:hypothetical protein
MHVTGHFSCPKGNKDLDIGLNPAWRDCVIDLIPFEPVAKNASKEAVVANAQRMTFTIQQALRDIAPQSGAYFNEVSAIIECCIFETDRILIAILPFSAIPRSRTGEGHFSDGIMTDYSE